MTEQAKLEHREGSSYKGLCSGFVFVCLFVCVFLDYKIKEIANSF